MTLSVISAGFGRTGTMSLKLALEQIGHGPCHHMVEVIENGEGQVPLWNDALACNPDFDAIYAGYTSAVDWPTAAFWQELASAYPAAKVILSTRSPESWYSSISETILATVWAPDKWPPPAVEWFKMVTKVLDRSFGGAKDKEGIIAAFNAHEASVKAAIPGRPAAGAFGKGWLGTALRLPRRACSRHALSAHQQQGRILPAHEESDGL